MSRVVAQHSFAANEHPGNADVIPSEATLLTLPGSDPRPQKAAALIQSGGQTELVVSGKRRKAKIIPIIVGAVREGS